MALPNAIAGDDLRVEVARVTTCGDWTFSANCQVFVNGDLNQEQLWFIEEQSLNGFIEVAHPCLDYQNSEASVSGLDPLCYNGTTEVEMEFLGSDDELTTSYELFTVWVRRRRLGPGVDHRHPCV